MDKKILIKSSIALTSFAIIVSTYFLYQQSLFDQSLDIIEYLQERDPGQGETRFWTIFAKVSLFSLQNGPMIFVVANQKDRVAAFYVVFVYISTIYITGILQLLLHKPRPYWVNEEIVTYDCHPSYSSPDGVTCINTTIFMTLWLVCGFGPKPKCKTIFKKFNSMILVMATIGTASYGHLLNGDTSIDQQLFAFLLSCWIAVTFFVLFQEPIYEHIKQLHQGKTRNPDLPLKKWALRALGVAALTLAIGAIFYYSEVATIVNDPVWETFIKDKCPDLFDHYQTMERIYAGDIYASFGKIGYLLGAYFGIFYSYVKYEGLTKFQDAKKCAVLKLTARQLLLLCFCVPNGLVFTFVGPARNLYVMLFLQNLLHSFILFFLLFAFADIVLLKIRLYDPADEEEEVDPMLYERSDYHKSLEAKSPQSTPATSLKVVDSANIKNKVQVMNTSGSDLGGLFTTYGSSPIDISVEDDE